MNPEWARARQGEAEPGRETPPREATLTIAAKVTFVSPGSPAEAAGLRTGDRIVALDDEAIGNLNTPPLWPDREVTMRVQRAGEAERDVTMVPGWNKKLGRRTTGFLYRNFETLGDAEPTSPVRIPLEIPPSIGAEPVHGHVDLGPEKNDGFGLCREIRELVFDYESPDGVREYDVIRRFNTHGAKISWNPDIETGGVCSSSGQIHIRSLSGTDTVGTLIHELRHSDQFARGKYDDISRYYLDADFRMSLDEDAVGALSLLDPERLNVVLGYFSENGISDEWQKKVQEICGRARALSDKSRTRPESAAEEAKALFDERVIGQATVRDILFLPTALVERDAEYGRLVGLRAIKKETGVDWLGDQGHATEQELSDTGGRSTTPQKRIASLVDVNAYMQKIGVPYGCIRHLRKAGAASRRPAETTADEA